jgi:hypothetical protein
MPRSRPTLLAVLFVASSALIGCATPSKPGPIAEPAPLAADPRVCARLEPEPPVQGGIIQPATDAEREATEAFLTGESEARAWGRRGWERAKLARARECSGS